MSAIGTKRTWPSALHMSAFGGKADMLGRHSHYDFPVLQFGKLSLAPWERAREIGFQSIWPPLIGGSRACSRTRPADAIRRYFLGGSRYWRTTQIALHYAEKEHKPLILM